MKDQPKQDWGFWLLYFMPWAAVLIRIVFSVIPEYGLLPAPFILFGAYLVLSASQPAISARFPVLTQPSLLLQALVVAALVLIPPPLDYYALLFVPLGLIATKYLPYGRDLIWVGMLCVLVTATLLVAHGLAQGLSFCITYVAGILLLSLYGRTARKAEEARKRSEELLVQLRAANRKLSQYADQAEEVATVHERNRLARELHDAATQTVFSLTLTAEAARLACEQDPGRLPALLERIQESGADALAEMRALVSELRMRYVAEDGLVPTLRQHFATRERREKLRIAFAVEGEERGEVEAKEALFRTVQEALNNAVKHAGVELAEVYLAFGDREAVLRIRDNGKGFDPAAAASGKGFGLLNMRERIESRGGRFQLASSPGSGTEISISIPLFAEGSQNE